MMGKKILILNLLLVAGTVAVARQLVTDWQSIESERRLERIIIQAGTAELSPEASMELLSETAPVREFFVIAERDLFSPERQPASEEAAGAEVETAPEFPRRPQMNGVTSSGGDTRALLTVFATKKDQAGETRPYGVGDDVQGYTVTEISDTTVTLQWNDVVELIDMMDTGPSATPRAPKGKQLAALNIIRIGSRHAAVETTSTEGADEEGRGLQIGVVGGQTGRGGVAGAGGARGGAARLPGGARGAQGLGGAGTRGIGGTGQFGGVAPNLGIGGQSQGMLGSQRRPRY
jgi:hypothetical protein